SSTNTSSWCDFVTSLATESDTWEASVSSRLIDSARCRIWWSTRRARILAQHIPRITTLNGNAVASAADCNATSPPASSRAAATAPSSTANVTRDQMGGFGCPPEASISITSEPESEEVMKKIATRKIAITEKMLPSGRFPSASKMALSTTRFPSASTFCDTMSTPPKNCSYSPVPPRTENHRKPTMLGTSNTPVMNSRIVRPREMRAMNTPTNGDQAIHQPQ